MDEGPARLAGVAGLVEAMLDFKRRDADALAAATREGGADDDARREPRAGRVRPRDALERERHPGRGLGRGSRAVRAGDDAGDSTARCGVPGKDSPKLTMSDEDVLEMLNL